MATQPTFSKVVIVAGQHGGVRFEVYVQIEGLLCFLGSFPTQELSDMALSSIPTLQSISWANGRAGLIKEIGRASWRERV